MSTWAAQSAQAASRLSWSPSSWPLWRGAVAGRVQGVTAGQPVTISVGAGEGGALAQPSSSVRQRLVSPMAKCGVFTGEGLKLSLARRQGGAQVVLHQAQVHLGYAFIAQHIPQTGNLSGGALGFGTGGRQRLQGHVRAALRNLQA